MTSMMMIGGGDGSLSLIRSMRLSESWSSGWRANNGNSSAKASLNAAGPWEWSAVSDRRNADAIVQLRSNIHGVLDAEARRQLWTRWLWKGGEKTDRIGGTSQKQNWTPDNQPLYELLWNIMIIRSQYFRPDWYPSTSLFMSVTAFIYKHHNYRGVE